MTRRKIHLKQTGIEGHAIYVNARSVLANLPQIEALCFERKPSLVLCAEARITQDISDSEYAIDGYNVVVCESQSRFTGGVAIYIRKTLKYKVIVNNFVEKLIWTLAIELIDCEIHGIFAVFYRSPAQNLNLSCEFFDQFLEQIINLNKVNVIAGDMNVDLNVTNNNTRSINSLLAKHDMNLCVNFDTRITNETQTLIDYVLSNDCDKVSCKPLPCDIISDHETIDIMISNRNNISGSPEVVLSWSMYNKEQLINNLRNKF